MTDIFIEYLLFVGLGLYALTALLFLFLFLRTLRTEDGIGLLFLRLLTFAVFVGSSVITVTRFAALYIPNWNVDVGRAIAVVNPLTLLGVGLYLNFLFHQKYKK